MSTRSTTSGAKHERRDWQTRVAYNRAGITKVLRDIERGIIDEEDLQKLSGFCMYALALMDKHGPAEWQAAKVTAELLDLTHGQAPEPATYEAGNYTPRGAANQEDAAAVFDGYIDGFPVIKWRGAPLPVGTKFYTLPSPGAANQEERPDEPCDNCGLGHPSNNCIYRP